MHHAPHVVEHQFLGYISHMIQATYIARCINTNVLKSGEDHIFMDTMSVHTIIHGCLKTPNEPSHDVSGVSVTPILLLQKKKRIMFTCLFSGFHHGLQTLFTSTHQLLLFGGCEASHELIYISVYRNSRVVMILESRIIKESIKKTT